MVLSKDTKLKRLFTWTDRHPIGILHTSDSGFISASNPAGWLFDQSRGLRSGMMTYAARSIEVLKRIDAQGMIVWDLEGMRYPKAAYLGAPDIVLDINREYGDGVLDEFFHYYTLADIVTGLLIRPDEPMFDTENNTWVNTVSADPFQTLLRKATYAHKRWKCRIFYVDTNMYDYRRSGELIPATTFERLHKALPDCLWIPEHMKEPGGDDIDYSYYQSTAPYMELRNGSVGTPTRVYGEVKDAFGVLNVTGGRIRENREVLRSSLSIGDILMVDGWWDNPTIADVEELLKD